MGNSACQSKTWPGIRMTCQSQAVCPTGLHVQGSQWEPLQMPGDKLCKLVSSRSSTSAGQTVLSCASYETESKMYLATSAWCRT